jgi:hypothetical protein
VGRREQARDETAGFCVWEKYNNLGSQLVDDCMMMVCYFIFVSSFNSASSGSWIGDIFMVF